MVNHSLQDLLTLMQRLRDPRDGCPWDREQDFTTIAPHTLEECYELIDAIESGNDRQIREELGDLLFQVVFYTQLGAERGAFGFHDVVDTLVEKLLRRHPHVFPDGTLASRVDRQTTATAQVKTAWETIKAEERREKQQGGVLDDVPVALPALTRAVKLQKRASTVGFDWQDDDGVLAQIASELEELRQARAANDQANMEEEFGDVLFCLVNLARHWKINPESSLRAANRKFEARFRYIEQALIDRGSSPAEASLETMDQLWNEAKTHGL